MQHRHKSVEDFKTDVDTLYDLLHENPDNHESRVYLIEVLTECISNFVYIIKKFLAICQDKFPYKLYRCPPPTV